MALWTLIRKEYKGFGHKLVPRKIKNVDDQVWGIYSTKKQAIQRARSGKSF